MQKMKQDDTDDLRSSELIMPTQKYVKALRHNAARSLAYYAREYKRKTADIQKDVSDFLEDQEVDDIKITSTDISRTRNTIGGQSGEGAPVSVAKLGVLERFLKHKKVWRQYVSASQSLTERYYTNAAKILCAGLQQPPQVIENFYERRADLERGSEPEILGHYSIVRRSMHDLGRFNCSKIRFFKNAEDKNIYEFEETRLIRKRSGQSYNLTYSGFITFIRNTYILQGVSYIEEDKEKNDHHYTAFPEMVYIHNDRDVHRLVGIWTSVTRENSHPCSSPIVMRKVDEEKFNKISLGLYDEKDIHEDDMRVFKNALSSEYGMIYVDGMFNDQAPSAN